jgi:ABC-2 type transport system permease protein
MLRDAMLVAGKDLREVLLRQGGLRANVLNWGLIVLIFGIVIPVRVGEYWIRYPFYVMTWAWLPLMLVSAVVADSFAGERERHTLETLLATRLSDHSILFGKVGAAVAYAMGILLLLMGSSLLSLNLAHGAWDELMLWSVGTTLAIAAFGALVIVLVSSVGVMVSLKAKTVRQAGQRLSLGLIAFFTLPGLVLGMAYQALPQGNQDAVIAFLSMLEGSTVALFFAVALVMLDTLFVAMTVRRFRRSRLTFD